MPSPYLKKLSERTGKPLSWWEDKWDKAKEQYGDNYEAVVGTMKKIASNIEEVGVSEVAKKYTPTNQTAAFGEKPKEQGFPPAKSSGCLDAGANLGIGKEDPKMKQKPYKKSVFCDKLDIVFGV